MAISESEWGDEIWTSAYKARDALKRLQESVEYETVAEMELGYCLRQLSKAKEWIEEAEKMIRIMKREREMQPAQLFENLDN